MLILWFFEGEAIDKTLLLDIQVFNQALSILD